MTKPTQNRKIERKKIDKPLLAERLGLDEPWIERWEEGCEWKEESCAPDQLPEFICKGRTKRELEEIEEDIRRLVAAGCERRVVNFCLAQLSPEAEWLRAGGETQSIPGGTEDEDYSVRKRRRPLKTREDLESVVNTANNVRKLIRKYQRELLLVADTKVYPLPEGMTTQLDDADDAIALLESSLAWIAKLAEGYAAPYETTLLKSKGLLYLVAYVSMYADKGKLRSPQHLTEKDIGVPNKREVRARSDDRPLGNALASLVTTCTGKDGGWSPSDLYAKLHKLQADHPRLYFQLNAKLKELHEFVSQ